MSFEMGRVIGTSLKIDFSHSVEMTPDKHKSHGTGSVFEKIRAISVDI